MFERSQQFRWMRPNAHLYVRQDAHRFMTPGAPRLIGRDVAKYFEPIQRDGWLRDLQTRERKYSPNQPRVPAGSPEGGQWISDEGEGAGTGEASDLPVQVAGTVIRVCIAGSRSLTTDGFGNKSFWVEYLCAGGRSLTLSGSGHRFPGIKIDPFR